MKRIRNQVTMVSALSLVLLLTIVLSQAVTAKTANTSNMTGNCEPYHVQNAKVMGSFAMGGENYTDGILFSMGYNGSEDGYTARADFTLDQQFTGLKFQTGCIAGSKDAKLKILADGKVAAEHDISATAMPQEIAVNLTEVQAMSIIYYCENYSENYNMAIYGIGGIQFVSDGVLKGIRLAEDKIVLNSSAPSVQLQTVSVPFDAVLPELEYSSSNPGIATVDEKGVVTGLYGGTTVITVSSKDGAYKAECEVTVDMPKDISEAKITLNNDYFVYSGDAVVPEVVVSKDDKELVLNEDYIVIYKNNTEVGIGSVSIKGINAYGNTVTKDITIVPKAPEVSALSNVSSGIKVTWSQVAGAKGYYIYRKTGAGGSYKLLKNITSATTVSYTDTSVSTASTKMYYYVVYAYSDDRISAASEEKRLYRLSGTTITSVANSNTGIKIQWNKVDNVTGYLIYRKEGTGAYTQIKKVTKNTTISYNDTTANTNGAKYTYKVYTYRSTSQSAASAGVKTYRQSRMTLSKISNPSYRAIALIWSAKTGCTGYEVEYATNSSFTSSTVKTIKTGTKLTGLTKGKTYHVRIRSYKTVSGVKYYSAWSAKKSIKISR